jgi:hypothetical protein
VTPQERYSLAIDSLADAERTAARNPHDMAAVARVIAGRRRAAQAYAAIPVPVRPVPIGQPWVSMARRPAYVPRASKPSGRWGL